MYSKVIYMWQNCPATKPKSLCRTNLHVGGKYQVSISQQRRSFGAYWPAGVCVCSWVEIVPIPIPLQNTNTNTQLTCWGLCELLREGWPGRKADQTAVCPGHWAGRFLDLKPGCEKWETCDEGKCIKCDTRCALNIEVHWAGNFLISFPARPSTRL